MPGLFGDVSFSARKGIQKWNSDGMMGKLCVFVCNVCPFFEIENFVEILQKFLQKVFVVEAR